MATTMASLFRTVMSHPLAIITGVAIGTYVGLYHEEMGRNLAPWGKLYLSALQMTIIPYIVVTVSSSIAKLLGAHEAKMYIKKILITFLSMLTFVRCTDSCRLSMVAVVFDVFATII